MSYDNHFIEPHILLSKNVFIVIKINLLCPVKYQEILVFGVILKQITVDRYKQFSLNV